MPVTLPSVFVESGYSFSGSNITVEWLIEHAKETGQDSVVLTDNRMHAAYRFLQEGAAAGLKTVLGLQCRLEPLFDGPYIHVVAYAQSTRGYKSLMKIASLQSFNKTLSFSLYKKYANEVTTVLGVHEGEGRTTCENPRGFQQLTEALKAITTTLYVADHPAYALPEDAKVKRLPTDYVKYREGQDKDVYHALRRIFQLPVDHTVDDVDAHGDSTQKHRTLDEADAHTLTTFITEHTITLDLASPSLPTYPDTQGLSSDGYLAALAQKGLDKRLKHTQKDMTPYRRRLKEELETIHTLGYDDYFLIVWDVVRYAKQRGMLVGPGRGSAPGSLVAYALGITDVDPLQYGLVFERFLNPARQSMPDIDIDFPDYARDEVIAYTRTRYGNEFVSTICTFGTFLKKSALRESARVFEVAPKHVEEMARRLDKYSSIALMVKADKDVQNRISQHESIAEWLRVAARIEGLPKHVGTHAAGIVLTHEPLIEYTPIQPGLNNSHQTQYEQQDLEHMGLLKMDFLGLRNLTFIETVLGDIERHIGKRVNIYRVNLDDKKTFTMLREGSTSGIFQLESRGMRRLIRDMKIRSFDDIVTILALFRPGPMESIDTYLRRRQKKEPVRTPHPSLDAILRDTEGILLYQEQIMAMAAAFANYSMSEADLLRRAVSKKDAEGLENERKRFVRKAVQAGRDHQLADEIYDYIVKFANYGFNKSHSVAYAIISYWMAYLKANYPAYFVGVLMQRALANETLMREYIREATHHGLTVMAPDINLSTDRFTHHKHALYYPLTGIRNVGKSVLQAIEEARQDKPFASFADMVERTRGTVNRRTMQSLIFAGACDGFNLTKQTMIENLEALDHYIEYQGAEALNEFVYDKKAEFDDALLKEKELECLGFNLTHDPIRRHLSALKRAKITPSKITRRHRDQRLELTAVIAEVREITTKKGDAMAFVTLEDDGGKLDAVCFPKTYGVYGERLLIGALLRLAGSVKLKEERLQFVIERVGKTTE